MHACMHTERDTCTHAHKTERELGGEMQQDTDIHLERQRHRERDIHR